MKAEDKNLDHTNDHRTAGNPTIYREKPARPGAMKRFLDWIAKGAEESGVNKTCCSARRTRR